MEKWSPFIHDCLRFLDGDGTYRHWKYGLDYSEQPYLDIQIYDVVRSKYVQLRNEEIKRSTKH